MHSIAVKTEDVFQAVADPTRVRIIRLLAQANEELCLCEFVDCLLEPQYKLSRHIKVLRQAGIISATKDGRWIYHRLVSGYPYLDHLYLAIKSLPDTEKLFGSDLKRFRTRLKLREDGRCRVGIQTKELVEA